MQNQGFHSVCKKDVPQPNKYLKIYIFGPKYVPKSPPKLLRISVFDFVTFWNTFWLRLGSHFAPGLAQDEPIRAPKALPVAPKGSKGLPRGSPRRPKGAKGLPKGSPRPFLDHFDNKFATFGF